jgi:hypothetical protein
MARNSRPASQLSPCDQGHGVGLGKTRYVVERSMAWLENFRRINRCGEAKGEPLQAFNQLAACVLDANKLRRHTATRLTQRTAARRL